MISLLWVLFPGGSDFFVSLWLFYMGYLCFFDGKNFGGHIQGDLKKRVPRKIAITSKIIELEQKFLRRFVAILST